MIVATQRSSGSPRGTTTRAGLTLLELVVALAVGGLALAAGGAAFAVLSDRRQALLAEADRDGRSLAARRALAHWVAEVRLAPDGHGTPFRGLHGTRRTRDGEVADDELSLLTTAPSPVGDDAALVRLFVQREADAESGALVAELRPADALPGTALVRVVLAERVTSFSARYYTQAFGRVEWLDSWASSTLLPGAVEVRLQFARDDSVAGAWRLPLTMPLANGR